MKKGLLLFALLFSALANAGQGGPDAYGYTWIDSQEPGGPTYGWVDIANPSDGIQVLGLGDDNVVGPFTIANNQNFHFYWYDVSQFWIGSNGYISFNQVNIASPFPNIPTSGGPNDFIAGMMSDLKFDGAANPAECWIGRNTDSTVISFINVPFWDLTIAGYSGSNTFQIILDDSDSSIYINVQQQMGTGFQVQGVIGIENTTGGVGLEHSFNQFPPALYSIKFEYPDVVTYQATDGRVNWNDNENNKGVFIGANGPAIDLVTNVGNSGNQALSPFTATGKIVNNLGSTLLTTAVSVPALSAGQDTTLTYPATWSPGNAGTYIHQTSISGIAGDLVAANNSIDREIVVVDTTQTSITLDYTEGVSNGSLAWNGGNGGVAMYFVPPTHPAKITHMGFYHVSNTGASSFAAILYRDDGPGGSHGTLLDSVYVPAANILLNQYTSVPLTNPVTIADSGVYVLWRMEGANLNIGSSSTGPTSRHGYEVLDGVWAAYRAFDTEDFLINLTYEPEYIEDIGASSILSPTGNVATPELVRVYLRNFGQTPVNQFDVSYQLANGTAITQAYNGSGIPPNDSILFTFQTLMSLAPGSGDLCIWTSSTAIADANSGNDTTCTPIITPPSSLEENEAPFTLYPNPARDYLMIDAVEAIEPLGLEIYNSQGQIVGRYAVPQGQTTRISINRLAAGCYTYVLSDQHQRSVGVLLVQ